ncbi:MAG: folylpolyglutamate synthase/dihydrofolate synthase family protein [Candidatus Omnitrophota bacterium]
MTYPEVKKYLYSFVNYENLYKYSYKNSFKLDRFKSFLKTIGNPQLKLKVIHVAGSKGKGSVCVFIANILRQAGFKVGLYTSPHLSDFRERIRILYKKSKIVQNEFEGMISKNEICNLVKEIKPAIDKFNKNSKYDSLSFFEVYTALAFRYFRDQQVDFVVLETGLGGRLDATNTCKSLASIITPISLEHTSLLGKTLKDIAYEKASIIKKGNSKTNKNKILALTAKQDKPVNKVIESKVKHNNSILFKEGSDFKFILRNKSHFDYKGIYYNVGNLSINLLGRHQIANASLAIASIEALRYHNINVSQEAIRNGLRNSNWPARFEIIAKEPTLIIDGAQNSASVKALGETLRENFPHRKVWVIFGIARDKELKDTCRQVENIAKDIILTKSSNPRASEPNDLVQFFKKMPIMVADTLKTALKMVKSIVNKKDLIVVTGSLYLCAEAKEIKNKLG